jgi:putative glutamine amidotransferase
MINADPSRLNERGSAGALASCRLFSSQQSAIENHKLKLRPEGAKHSDTAETGKINKVIPRIAIPLAHSQNAEYSQRVKPHYADAVRLVGGEPVEVPLDLDNPAIMRIATSCDGVLLPGSRADVNPEKYGARERHAETADADPLRDNVDELLIQDAFNMRKPLFGICFGMQILNVWRTGTLIQHLNTGVQHNGPNAPEHMVRVEPDSVVGHITRSYLDAANQLTVNTSHHQAVDTPGDGLRIVARSGTDDVIEAVEGTSMANWVVAVQWHPERMMSDPAQRALFKAFIEAARQWHERAARSGADFEMMKR